MDNDARKHAASRTIQGDDQPETSYTVLVSGGEVEINAARFMENEHVFSRLVMSTETLARLIVAAQWAMEKSAIFDQLRAAHEDQAQADGWQSLKQHVLNAQAAQREINRITGGNQ